MLRVFSKPSGRYRSKAPCGLQVKGLNDTALRAPPWPSRMAVDQSGPPVGLDLPTPGSLPGTDVIIPTGPTAKARPARVRRRTRDGPGRAWFQPRGRSNPRARE